MKSFIVCISLLLAALSARAEPFSYLRTVAKPGDGMYALFRRYALPANACNRDRFIELNKLAADEPLLAGSTYQLPVLVYTYNGTSIRSTLGIDDMPFARRIQAYNRALERTPTKAKAYETSKALWVPYAFLFCDDQREAPAESESPTPATTAAATSPANVEGYAIFGAEHARVRRIDQQLAGKYFYLVAGHGGPDPGALGQKKEHQLCEDEYAYDVVLRLARKIIAHGGTPYVIIRDANDGIRDDEYLDCDYDETAWGDLAIPRDQRLRLAQRSDIINTLSASAKTQGISDRYCIVVHVDSRHEDTQTDLFFYHQADSEVSRDLALELQATMKRNYRRNRRTREYTGAVRTRDLHMLREVEVPTVYIELGNIRHTFDQKRVLRPSNREALANWFAEGLMRGTSSD